MRKIILFLLFTLLPTLLPAQEEYTIRSAGQGKTGSYLVEVVVSTKKRETKEAEDLVKKCAVHGVLFRGFLSSDGYGEQKPLLSDPNVEQTQAKFFNAFFSEGAYRRYASTVPTTLSVMKNKQTKRYEASATVVVDKESLQHYLEEQGVAKGFSNLW